jgi:hypothetical protein
VETTDNFRAAAFWQTWSLPGILIVLEEELILLRDSTVAIAKSEVDLDDYYHQYHQRSAISSALC